MNKKLLLCGTLVLGISLSTACQKKDVKVLEENYKPPISQDAEENKTEDINIVKFESDTIDFSKIEYKTSETERNESLEKIIINHLDYDTEYGAIEYFYNYIDLNEDGQEEAFVYLTGSYVSGSGGSTALIIDEENEKVISAFTLVRNPILISEEKTNGWNNIIMNVSGGGLESFYAKLEFDGEKYPSNPSTAPALEDGIIIEGISIISNDTSYGMGIEIK